MNLLSVFQKDKKRPMETTAEIGCPICGGVQQDIVECGTTRFVTGPSRKHAESQNCRKYKCKDCAHLWTPWLDRNLKEVSEIYDGIYGEVANESVNVNFRSAHQLELITLGLLATDQKYPCLDFGCGPNSLVTLMLRKLGKPVHCCDISNFYPYDNEGFFRHSFDPRWHGYFGSVVSIEVIEHLGDPLESWLYFNRILKPSGAMYHVFPSLIHCEIQHHYITNAFHTCLFSEQSLRRLCERTGFEFRGFVTSQIPSADLTLQNIFYFQKVRTV